MASTRPTYMTIVYIALLILLAVGWVVLLAGTGAAQTACVNILDKAQAVNGRRLLEVDVMVQATRELMSVSHGRQLLASNSESCSNDYSLIWWTVWFEFLCIVLAAVVTFVTPLQRRFSLAVTLFFVIATTILMGTAKSANDDIFQFKDSTVKEIKDSVAASRAGLAGAIMCMIFNFVYIVLSTDSMGEPAPDVTLPTQNGHASPAGKGALPYEPAASATPVYQQSPATYPGQPQPPPAPYPQQQQQAPAPYPQPPPEQHYPSYTGAEAQPGHPAAHAVDVANQQAPPAKW